MQLVATIIPEIPHDLFLSKLEMHLHSEEIKRIKEISNIMQAQRSGIGSLLVAHIVNGISGVPKRGISMHRYPSGKPFLPDFPNLHFNISHTNNIVVAAVGNHVVGIDIETVSTARMSIAKRFFSKSELELLKHCKKRELDTLFFELWTARESFAKATGTGIFASISHFIPEKIENGWQVNDKTTGIWSIRHYRYGDNFVIALCVAKEKEFPEAIETIELEKLWA
jgi:4'-phosphopantetheinyl transferase